jgi:hypothetical protein
MLKREVTIRILVDDVDQHLMQHITQINTEIGYNMIQFLYSHELGNVDELVLLSDNNYYFGSNMTTKQIDCFVLK